MTIYLTPFIVFFMTVLSLRALSGTTAQAQALADTCTLVGCSSNARFDILMSDGRPPDFGLIVEVDGKTSTCTMPDTSSGDWSRAKCGDGIHVGIREFITTTSTQISESTWSIEKHPTGRFEVRVGIGGSPDKVTISLMEGNRKTAERQFIPTYREIYPNGSWCDVKPCRTFDVTWEIL